VSIFFDQYISCVSLYVCIYILCDYTVYRYYYIYIYIILIIIIIDTILRAVEAPFSTKQVTGWCPKYSRASGPTAGCSGHFPANYPVPPSPSPGTWKKQCHEPPIWEWVIPPIKMVKLGRVYIFHQHSCLFFCKGALHPILESCLARHSPHIQWSHPGPWHLPKCEGTQKHLNGIAFSTTAWQEKIGDTHKQPFDWGTSW
jgi:hypothetical protein